MKLGSILLIGGAVLAVAYFGNLGVAANTIQVVLQDVQINGLTNFTIKLMVQNVSNATLNINSMTGTVSINGTFIGNVSSFSQTPGQPALQVLPNSEQIITVTLNPSLLSLPGVVQQMINSPTGLNNLTFVVAGNINLNSIDVPFSVQDVVTI